MGRRAGRAGKEEVKPAERLPNQLHDGGRQLDGIKETDWQSESC